MSYQIATSTSADAVAFLNNVSFYAKGFHWVFYDSALGAGKVTVSPDGITWSTPAVAGLIGGVVVAYDGNNYIHAVEASGTDIWYSRGLLNANGTVTWDGWVQIVLAAGSPISLAYITLDSNGNPWVGYTQDAGGVGSYTPWITMSTTHNGTWTVGGGYPLQLSAAANPAAYDVYPIALTSGKIYAAYYVTGGTTVRGKLNVGAGFGGEEIVSAGTVYADSSMNNNGDDLYLVYSKNGTSENWFRKRTYGVGWGTEVLFHTNTAGLPAEIILVPVENVVYGFLDRSIDNYLKTRVIYGDGVWTDWVNLVQYSNQIRMSTFNKVYGNYVGLVYTMGAASPYTVMYRPLIFLTAAMKSSKSL